MDQYHYFYEEYKEREAAFQTQIQTLGAQRAQLRYETVQEAVPQQLDDARKELYRQEKNLADGRKTMSMLLQMIGLSGNLEEDLAQLSDNERFRDPMEQAVPAFETGELALAEGWTALEQAEEAAGELEYYDWTGYWRCSQHRDCGGVSYSMAIIFVIVAVTVCYAAISRMISESSALMGMQKAWGFTSKEIRNHFMAYSILCGVWGALEGWVCGYAVVQFMNVKIYQTLFLMGNIPLAFSWDSAVFVSVFFIGIFILSAWAACARKVKLSATDLLRGKTAQRDRKFWFESWKPYQKLRLYSKTMIKNALVDKSRMLTTIMGVAGCATLLVISFTLLLAMKESEVIPFEEYFLYENRLVIDSTRVTDKLKLCRP